MDVSRNLCNVSNLLSNAPTSTAEFLERLSVALEELRTISSISNKNADEAFEQVKALDENMKTLENSFEKIDNLQEYVNSTKQKLIQLDHLCNNLTKQ